MGEKQAELTEARPTPPTPPEKEKPIVDVGELLRLRRGKGEAGFWETLAYLDYQDRKEEREYRRQHLRNEPSAEVAELKARLAALEKKSELETHLAPIRDELKSLRDEIKEVAKAPATPAEPEGIKDIRSSLTALDKRLDAIDQRYQFTNEIQSIRTELTSLKDSINQRGGTAPASVGDLIDQATGLIDKINELTRKYGPAGEGEIDWRYAAITTTGEIATETIKAAKDIMAGKKEELETAPEERKQEKVSERIIDRKVMGYLSKELATGAKEFNTKEAATKLGLTPDQVFDSYKRLRDRGLLTEVAGRGKRAKEEGEVKEEGEAEFGVEGA